MTDKKIINGTADMMRLFPLTHEWAWDFYLKANANHWLPNDIEMSQDAKTLADPTLDPKKLHLFKTIFSQLTTFDILRGFDIADGISKHVSSPEIKMFLLRQAYEEMLHTHAYQYVVESTSLDENEIYTMYSTVPQMNTRVEYSKSFSVLAENLTEQDLKTRNGRTEFLLALVFYYLIFEGIWFTIGLIGPIQAMARFENIFKPTSEQFQYIFRDETIHISFGIQLINSFINENPDTWNIPTVEKIKDIVRYSIELEHDFIQYALPTPLVEYNSTDHIEMCYWLANKRMHSIGIQEDLYPQAICSMPWIYEQVSSIKESNFFERKVTEYRKSSINLTSIQPGLNLDWP